MFPKPKRFSTLLIVCVSIVGVVSTALAIPGCGSSESPTTLFKPSVDTRGLMQTVLDPAADGIWDAAGWVITDSGTESLFPTTDEQWQAVIHSAAVVAESGNLLMMPAHAQDRADWTEISGALVDAGIRVREAAVARDTDELFDAGGHVYNVCTSCHNKYWIQSAGD